jgi:hypothetical protein
MGLDQFHGYGSGVRWRLTAAGVDIEGSGAERTRGSPTTVSRVWDAYAGEIDRAARQYRVPVPLIIATICTESGGKADAVRLEPGYVSDEVTPKKMSAGLMQTLLSTARNTMKQSFGRDWLLVPGNSILAGTSYIAEQSSVTQLDPPLVAAAYNAGDLYPQDGAQNRWKLRQYPIGTGAHVDRFVKFYNDAMAVLAERGARCSVGQEASGSTARPESSSSRTPRKVISDSGTTVVDPDAPRIDFGESTHPEGMSAYTRGVLSDILRASKTKRCLVSSTSRTPEEQARVMFDNLVRYGAEAQRKLYARPGRRVIDVFEKQSTAGKSADEVKRAMAEEIRQIGPSSVSRHAADPQKLNVFDVAPSSIPDRRGFENAVREDKRVAYFLTPPVDPGYHLEIPQKQDA